MSKTLPPNATADGQQTPNIANANVSAAGKPSQNSESTPLWLRALESSVVTALITVILGGFVGQLIISSIQENSKQNDQVLADHRNYLERQQEIMKSTYDLVEECIFDSEALISLTGRPFQPDKIVPSQQEAVEKQRERRIEKHDEVIQKWQTERNKTGFLIQYFNPEQTELLSRWDTLEKSTTEMMLCAEAVHKEADRRHDTTDSLTTTSCRDFNDKVGRVRVDLASLAKIFEKVHEYKVPHVSNNNGLLIMGGILWPMVSAIAACVGVILALVFYTLNLRNTRLSNSARMVLDLVSTFNSPTMRAKRRLFAQALINKRPSIDLTGDAPVLEFFEEVGYMTRRGVLDKGMVWNSFSWWLGHYYAAVTNAPNLIADARAKSNSLSLFRETEWLYETLQKVGRREERTGINTYGSPTSINQFLDVESKLHDVA